MNERIEAARNRELEIERDTRSLARMMCGPLYLCRRFGLKVADIKRMEPYIMDAAKAGMYRQLEECRAEIDNEGK